MKIYVGIDPGQKGAIAFLNSFNSCVYDMPLLPNKEIDSKKLEKILLPSQGSLIVYLEKAQAMPKQGGTSTFNYGVGYGKIKSVLEIAGISYQEIRPAKWKKEFSLNADKKNSITTAIKLFPKLKDQFYGPKGGIKDGRAESLLLAEYARRKT